MKLIDLLNVMPEDEFLLINVDIDGLIFSAYHSAGTFLSFKTLCQRQVTWIQTSEENDQEEKIINVEIQS